MVVLSVLSLFEICDAAIEVFRRSNLSIELASAAHVVIDDVSPSGDVSFHIVLP